MTISGAQQASLTAGIVAGVPVAIGQSLEDLLHMVTSPIETYNAIKSLINSDDIFGNVSDALKQEYSKRIDNLINQYEQAGASGSFQAGVEIGRLLTDAGTLVAGGIGVGKGVAKVTEKVVSKIGKEAAEAAKPVSAVKPTAGTAQPTSSLSYIDEPPFNPTGSVGAAQPWTIKGRIKYVELPTEGKIRYVPPDTYSPTQQLPRGPNNGYLDKFGNEWTKGPSRTSGQAFEWDVQLSKTGRAQLGWASRDKSHLNVSLDGKITHK